MLQGEAKASFMLGILLVIFYAGAEVKAPDDAGSTAGEVVCICTSTTSDRPRHSKRTNSQVA